MPDRLNRHWWLVAVLLAALAACSSGGSTGSAGSTPGGTSTPGATSQQFCTSLHDMQVQSRAALTAVVTRSRTHLSQAVTGINRAFAAAERTAPAATRNAVDQMHHRLRSVITSVDNANVSVPDRGEFAPLIGGLINVATSAAHKAGCPPRTAEG